MVHRKLATLAVFAYVSIAIGAIRVRRKEQLPINEPLATTSDPLYKEVQYLIDELLPSDPHYEDLKPAIDELLASNSHYEDQPLAGDLKPALDELLARNSHYEDQPLADRPRDAHYKEPSLDEALAFDSLVVARDESSKARPRKEWKTFDSLVAPVVPAASALGKRRRPRKEWKTFDSPVAPAPVVPAASAREKRKSLPPWSAAEDEQLKNHVAEHGSKNWQVIATRLPDRDAKQVRERWRGSLRPHLKKSEWTPEEDQDILNGVKEMGTKWLQISEQYMPNRHDKDIRHRWISMMRAEKSSHHAAERQLWTKPEDERLKLLVAEHGSNKAWRAIAKRMRGRDNIQCWERWRNHLRPQLSKGGWTPEDDQEIWDRVTELGPKWSQIRKQYMPNRNGDDIRNRWSVIIRKALAPAGREWNAAELEMRAAEIERTEPPKGRRRAIS